MTDKNGIELTTGAIVEITGAYFKNDNGLYFVTSSPGDPTWSGSDHSLTKISKRGKVSTAKNRLCFWPISVFVSSRFERAKANEWNAEHAQIEVKTIENMTEVLAYFEQKADELRAQMKRHTWDFGEASEVVSKDQQMIAHYEAVLARISSPKKKPGEQAAETFYFTFGTNIKFPFRLGWVEVQAGTLDEAIEKFRAKYPDRTPGIVNCAFFYNSEQWARMDVEHNPTWDGARRCWDIIE